MIEACHCRGSPFDATPPSTAAERALWLRERFEELVEAVVASGRLRHFAGSHVGRGLLQVVGDVWGVAAVKQRGQSEGLRCRDPLVAGRVEAAVRIPDVRLDVAYVFVGGIGVAHLQPAWVFCQLRLVEELREREVRLETVPVARLEVRDVTFAVDAELDVESAGFLAAYPRHAPAVAPQNIHRDVEDVGVARERTPGLGKAIEEVAPVPVRAHAVRYRIGDGGEVAERRGYGQVVGSPGRLAEIPAAAFVPRFLRRPYSVQAEGLAGVVAGAVEPDLFIRDLWDVPGSPMPFASGMP